MATQEKVPTLAAVDDDSERDQGERIRERRVALGLSVSALARRAHVDRATLTRIEKGLHESTRDTTIAAVERALAELEQELGMDDPEREPGIVRFVVRGVYGAESLIVEGPVENIGDLERSVDRIMRRLRESGDET